MTTVPTQVVVDETTSPLLILNVPPSEQGTVLGADGLGVRFGYRTKSPGLVLASGNETTGPPSVVDQPSQSKYSLSALSNVFNCNCFGPLNVIDFKFGVSSNMSPPINRLAAVRDSNTTVSRGVLRKSAPAIDFIVPGIEMCFSCDFSKTS